MFRKMTFLTSFVVIGLGGAWIFYCCFLSQDAIKNYQKLLKKEALAASAKTFSSTHQTRQGVRKDIWFMQEDGSRLHYRIDSVSSLLSVVPLDSGVQVVEKLEKITCWMQDKLYTGQMGMQQVRLLQAEEGLYNFKQQEFTAQTVALSLFRLPGHELPSSYNLNEAFLRGIAKGVSFSFAEKLPKFQAEQFQASFKEGSK